VCWKFLCSTIVCFVKASKTLEDLAIQENESYTKRKVFFEFSLSKKNALESFGKSFFYLFLKDIAKLEQTKLAGKW
jgi:hypothetical protein